MGRSKITQAAKEEHYKLIQEHHLHAGEVVSFNCPHCSKEVVVEVKSLEGDPETLTVYWGKSSDDIEEEQRRT